MYITYEEYKKMGGALDETAFNIYIFEAEQTVRSETHNRVTVANETVKRCIVRIVDLLESAELAKKQISSESHDGFSQSFKVSDATEYSNKINEVIYKYLVHEVDEKGTPLLYRGVNYD